MAPVTFAAMTTPCGYKCGEVASALQKAIRRGNEKEALFWAAELDQAGFGNYVWKRLRIIASEDVGMGDPDAIVTVRALYENWQEAKKKMDAAARKGERVPDEGAPLFLAHAVIRLVRAEKSGIVVHAVMTFWAGKFGPAVRGRMGMEIPDVALDMHTGRGRQMGRGRKHFVEEAGWLANEHLPDPYAESGPATWIENESKQP